MIELNGKTFLVTSGPTYAPIDAVRVIANRSSGRLGSTIVYTLHQAGARVIQLAGELSLSCHDLYPHENLQDVEVNRFGLVSELKELMQEKITNLHIDAVIMAAAVLDYVPDQEMVGKKHSNEEEWVLKLKRGEKIIEQIRSWSSEILIVGFKLETQITLEELRERSAQLMQRSDAQFVIANLVEEITSSNHIGYLLERRDPDDIQISQPLNTRKEIANMLCLSLSRTLD